MPSRGKQARGNHSRSKRGSTRGPRAVAIGTSVVRVSIAASKSVVHVPVVADLSSNNLASAEDASPAPDNRVSSVAADHIDFAIVDKVSAAAVKPVSSTKGRRKVSPESRSRIMRSYPAGYGLASSFWAPEDENYCAHFTRPEFMEWKGPSRAFTEGEDLIDLFTPAAAVNSSPATDAQPAVTQSTGAQPTVTQSTDVPPADVQTAVRPSVLVTVNENVKHTDSLKPAEGLAGSKWAN